MDNNQCRTMATLNIPCVLLLFGIFCLRYASGRDCSNVQCPVERECRYPKISIPQPDPYNKCCNITECICEGSNQRLSSSHDPRIQLEAITRRYTNCTWVDGNLEIVQIQRDEEILQATQHIRVVTGYVLIALNSIHYIDLSSLRLIRGEALYYEGRTTAEFCGKTVKDPSEGYSLFVTNNHQETSDTEGVREIWMPRLTEISKGHVKFSDNRDLCFVDTIIFEGEILNTDTQVAHIPTSQAKCGTCSNKCKNEKVDNKLHCWGNDTDKCQQFTKLTCSKCNGRCNSEEGCCDSYCAAGCIVENKTEGIERSCHACKELNNFGVCVQKCPTGAINNPSSDVPTIDESKIRFQLTFYCVPECPSNRRMYDNSHCVLTCPENYYEENGICEKCDPPEKCKHICPGLEAGIGPLKHDTVIHMNNIGNFSKNCTIIEGSLNFLRSTFLGDSHCDIPALPSEGEELFSVFENVEEITGFLDIEYWPFKNLCIFKNLKRIRGYNVRYMTYSLLIMTGKRNLRELCFNSLKEIHAGLTLMQLNKGLCHANTVNWVPIFRYPYQTAKIEKKKRNKCVPCSTNCLPSDGCWGSDSDQCVTCKNYTDFTNSAGEFTPRWVLDQSTGLNLPGHNVTACVETCDLSKGVYVTSDRKCFPCHSQCNSTCIGPGPKNCSSANSPHGCKHVDFEGECISECPITHYANMTNFCLPCSCGCIDGGCTGPDDAYSDAGCSVCYKAYDDEDELMVYRGTQCQFCLDNLKNSECPHGCTHDNVTGEYECYNPPSSETIIWIVISCVILVLAMSILLIVYKCRRTIRTMQKHIGEKIVGDANQPNEFDTPVTPSGTEPNRAQLRIVKENELAMGKTLGSGAFGAVYKAVWTSMHIGGQNIKIPVAVKKLKTFSHNNEIMDEAYVMASVDSPYLVRLLGICMTEQVMLITQLMPLGSLLEYVRDNSDNIGSRHMLSWCTQIAKGMQYLQDKHLVHRDLAARNVLVKTPHHVKITDFGLAKMLNSDQSYYFAEGGKLPIKWLAIECITERQFSHQSDVWAFGVTCWEIFSFGARPYEGIHAMEILSLLERGERLIQPAICTIDVYMILVKCWMVDPLSRPKFPDLVNEFSNMCKDHTRYLLIKDDPGVFSPNPEEEKRFFENLIKEDNGDMDTELLVDEPDNYLLSRNTFPDPVYQNTPSVEQAQEMQNSNGGVSLNLNSNTGPTWTSNARKGSEENARYTEDPTQRRSAYFETPINEHDEMFDEENYLLPTPRKGKPDYFDPMKEKGRQADNDSLGKNTEHNCLLANDTYMDDTALHHNGNIASERFIEGPESLAPEYINTQNMENGIHHISQQMSPVDTNIPDILLEPNDFHVKPNGIIHGNNNKLPDATYLNSDQFLIQRENGVYNGLEEDSTNSVFLNRSDSDSSQKPIVASSSPLDQTFPHNPSVRYKSGSDPPIGGRSAPIRSNGSVCLENPEYMMLQDSVSDESKLLNELTA